MEKIRTLLHRLLSPPIIVTVLLTFFSASGIFFISSDNRKNKLIAYAVYFLSFYTLCVLAAAAVKIRNRLKAALRSGTHAAYLSEAELRIRVSLYTGTVINLAYAVFKLVTGILYDSVWLGSVAIYYFVLCIIRFTLIKYDRKINSMKKNHDRYQWKSYKICGILMLCLNLIISGMVFMMVYQNKGYLYPGFVFYASAVYTLYRLTIAVMKLIRFRKGNNPLLSAATALDFTIALMAMFALQTALFASFGTGIAENIRMTMNALTGGTVCVVIICISMYMTIRAVKKLKTLSSSGTI